MKTFSIALVLAMAASSRADTWKVKPQPSSSSATTKCDSYRSWLEAAAMQRPRISNTNDGKITLQIGATTMLSTDELIGADFMMGFWDVDAVAPSMGHTIVIRVHPKASKVEILFIQRLSADRGDACYAQWQGYAERVP